jgi:hypothetical protein
MKNTKSQFVTPEVMVTLSMLEINIKTSRFKALVTTKQGRKKAVKQEVQGSVSQEMKDWLCNVDKDIYIKTLLADGSELFVKTNEKTTGFKKYLKSIDLEFKPGLLYSLVFKCDNKSDSFAANPFRIVVMNERTIITMVTCMPKARVVTHDPNTGKQTVSYFTRKRTLQGENGPYVVDQFNDRSQYRRYIYEVEVPLTEPSYS